MIRTDALLIVMALAFAGVCSIQADELSSLMHEVPARSLDRVGTADNAVLRLHRKIGAGSVKLSYDGPTGYLADLLTS